MGAKACRHGFIAFIFDADAHGEKIVLYGKDQLTGKGPGPVNVFEIPAVKA